jgi:DNA-binding transcriptional MerR regulator
MLFFVATDTLITLNGGSDVQAEDKESKARLYRVGELARLTGVSVRALHHYDSIGLLQPSGRSESGYRLYDAADIARLGQIKSLQEVGFSLQEVRAFLESKAFSPERTLALHLERVRRQVEQGQRLEARLEAVLSRLRARGSVPTDELLELIEEITMLEKYYSPGDLAKLEQRREEVGEARIREVEAEWPRLMDDVRAAVERGDDPASEASQVLARRWNGLIEEFTSGDESVRQSLSTMYETESNVCGMDIESMRPLFEFIQRASHASQPAAEVDHRKL